MSTFFLTLILACGVVGFALLALGIGRLITGKNRFKPGSCGRNPHEKQDESCEKTSCSMCEHEGKNDDKK